MEKLARDFFERDCLIAAPELVGKILARRLDNGELLRLRITETEAYRGEEDTACHARFGRTKRAQTLYMRGGTVYVYLCYGIHWLLNIVTGDADDPQAVLIRGGEGGFGGPGKLTKRLEITGRQNRADICGDELWIEDDGKRFEITAHKRVGIDYATEEFRDKLWRFKIG